MCPWVTWVMAHVWPTLQALQGRTSNPCSWALQGQGGVSTPKISWLRDWNLMFSLCSWPWNDVNPCKSCILWNKSLFEIMFLGCCQRLPDLLSAHPKKQSHWGNHMQQQAGSRNAAHLSQNGTPKLQWYCEKWMKMRINHRVWGIDRTFRHGHRSSMFQLPLDWTRTGGPEPPENWPLRAAGNALCGTTVWSVELPT